MTEVDSSAELETIRKLPLEKRYVWRVASALKWGFADSDNLGVEADKRTWATEDFARVMDLLKFRPMQFCMFLKTLVGVEEMQRTTSKRTHSPTVRFGTADSADGGIIGTGSP